MGYGRLDATGFLLERNWCLICIALLCLSVRRGNVGLWQLHARRGGELGNIASVVCEVFGGLVVEAVISGRMETGAVFW